MSFDSDDFQAACAVPQYYDPVELINCLLTADS